MNLEEDEDPMALEPSVASAEAAPASQASASTSPTYEPMETSVAGYVRPRDEETPSGPPPKVRGDMQDFSAFARES